MSPQRSVWETTGLRRQVARLFLPLIVFASLAGRADGAQEQQQQLARATVIERVVCAGDASQSYALYLPSNYTPARRWPIIYGFDPAARGRVPVELFRE